MFERVIAGKAIATGAVAVTDAYRTVGAPTSTFHEFHEDEGISTVQFDVFPANAMYNTTTNAANAIA